MNLRSLLFIFILMSCSQNRNGSIETPSVVSGNSAQEESFEEDETTIPDIQIIDETERTNRKTEIDPIEVVEEEKIKNKKPHVKVTPVFPGFDPTKPKPDPKPIKKPDLVQEPKPVPVTPKPEEKPAPTKPEIIEEENALEDESPAQINDITCNMTLEDESSDESVGELILSVQKYSNSKSVATLILENEEGEVKKETKGTVSLDFDNGRIGFTPHSEKDKLVAPGEGLEISEVETLNEVCHKDVDIVPFKGQAGVYLYYKYDEEKALKDPKLYLNENANCSIKLEVVERFSSKENNC